MRVTSEAEPDLRARKHRGERRELDAYLAVSADQPTGQLRIGQDLFNRGVPMPRIAAPMHFEPTAGVYPSSDVVWLERERTTPGWRTYPPIPDRAIPSHVR